jgi:4'-phosphopantetheinyl transferase
MSHRPHSRILSIRSAGEWSGDVGVWRVGMESGPECLTGVEAVLSREELSRAGAFRSVRDYRRFVVAHTALRHILSQYTGIRPGELRFTKGSQGKPCLAAITSVRFSLSYSGEIAVIAVSQHGEIGVDVERVRNLAWGRLANRHFTPREVSTLHALVRSERRRGFFRLWTCKEAFLKAVGVGLTAPLNSFEVELQPGRPASLREDEGETWALSELEVPADYVAAVVVAR